MKILVIIGLGGFLGSVSRYLLHLAVTRVLPGIFPLGTFTVNMAGCMLLGIVYAFAEHHRVLSNEWRLFLAVGFCGSFTTFSTFALEGLLLLQQREWITFGGYAVASVIVGLAFTAAGYYLFYKTI